MWEKMWGGQENKWGTERELEESPPHPVPHKEALYMWPHTHARRASQTCPPGPVSNVFGLLPASTPSPLPASHLPSMLQGCLDQCLHNAPKKNDPVAKCLSHLVQSPFRPLVWPSHRSGGHTPHQFFTRPHQLGGPAGFLDLPFYKDRR